MPRIPDPASVSCADLLKVLGDETRLAVVEQLLDGAKHVKQMNERLEIEPSLLSHHLKVLRDAGLVTCRRDGRAVLYELTAPVVLRSDKSLDLGCCTISFRSSNSERPLS